MKQTVLLRKREAPEKRMNNLHDLIKEWRERSEKYKKSANSESFHKDLLAAISISALEDRAEEAEQCANELEKVLDTRVKDND